MHERQVIDLISLKPFDMETISNSVKKTRKVIIVEECMKTGGIGASLSATINESLFDDLDHQVKPLPGHRRLKGLARIAGVLKPYLSENTVPTRCTDPGCAARAPSGGKDGGGRPGGFKNVLHPS